MPLRQQRCRESFCLGRGEYECPPVAFSNASPLLPLSDPHQGAPELPPPLHTGLCLRVTSSKDPHAPQAVVWLSSGRRKEEAGRRKEPTAQAPEAHAPHATSLPSYPRSVVAVFFSLGPAEVSRTGDCVHFGGHVAMSRDVLSVIVGWGRSCYRN